MLVEARRDEIDINRLGKHFKELASYDISEQRLLGNIEHFLSLLEGRGSL